MSIFKIPKNLTSTSIVVIGDVHGFTKTYQKYVEALPPGTSTIQIGDMGIGFSGVGLHQMDSQHSWFRGNHDNPAKCRATTNYRGDYGYDPITGIFHIAGAWSIDRANRIAGISWWPDEELSYEELGNVLAWYEQVKPRFVLTHDAPSKVASTLLYNLSGPYFAAKLNGVKHSRTSQALQQMLEIHQPEKWIFGHFHVDAFDFYVPGFDTKFTCVGGMMNSGEPPHVYVLETK